MLHRTFPGAPESIETTSAWITTTVDAQQSRISLADAVQVGSALVAAALHHTPRDGSFEIKLLPMPDGGLVILVKDPNAPAAPRPGGWAEVSRRVRAFGTTTSPEGGHIAWCELPQAVSP
ncbi:hypothetical protein AB0I81_12065 [Nonomuraea sp. NPDC050404]|uniref:hypothetical protein n=1 Tax=Nonomuraea sp. NPDC050404 TaxID=3155783 RepID=UPI00340D28C3